MKYCKRCIMPDTRPDQIFDEKGICNACKSYDVNQKINWDDRKKELLDIVSYAKSFTLKPIKPPNSSNQDLSKILLFNDLEGPPYSICGFSPHRIKGIL